MQEPSVLDYLKSLIDPRRPRIAIPDLESEIDSGQEIWDLESELSENTSVKHATVEIESAVGSVQIVDQVFDDVDENTAIDFKGKSLGKIWRVFAALFMILLAQANLEVSKNASSGLFFYGIAVLLLVWTYIQDEWVIPELPDVQINQGNLVVRTKWFFLGTFLLIVAFLMFGGNRFTTANFLLWWAVIFIFFFAFWSKSFGQVVNELRGKVVRWQQLMPGKFDVSFWALAVWGVFLLGAFYRLYRLDQVPPEMFSDHAEKLLDVADVLSGKTSIFFPRNTGREAFQMYLTAAIAKYVGTGLSFTSLKLGTMLAGLFTLPFIYLLGKELGNRRVGMLAMLFSGIAYWPNVISRVALRFTLYPFFTAPTLYFLVRGLRRRSINDFIAAGIFLGLGLHGYSPFRFVALAVLVIFIVYWLHERSQEAVKHAFWGLMTLVWFSLLVFLPLLRFITETPDNYRIFSYRSLTRLTGVENPLPGNPVPLFLENMGKVLVMPAWDNGNIWVHSVVNRPALDIVSAGLFYAGVFMLFLRYIQKRKWEDLALLLFVPLLMMPSALSIAFPGENPSLNRTGGAVIPVFVITALALDGLLSGIIRKGGRFGRSAAVGVFLFLFSWSAYQNYDLVFNQFYEQFRQSAWNTSEIGAVINSYAESYGRADNAFVVPYPHWVDTRLVGIRAGFPLRDFALFREQISDTQTIFGPKLFILNPQDQETIVLLEQQYPDGVFELYESAVNSGKNFMMFFVVNSQ